MTMICPLEVVSETLNHLREAGERGCECVVLWLGHRIDDRIRVERAYRPAQAAREDMFHIPSESMAELHAELRRHRLMVAAQVHSHPFQAFHSRADDRWAIVRHEGALSLVVPFFASNTSIDTFFANTKVFRFSPAAKWIEVPATGMVGHA